MVDNNFFADAARVYITQRAINIDEYLGFSNKKGSKPDNLSAAVIKSDCTRVVGRESVRIYAGGGSADGFGQFGEKRADASEIVNPRIELIVGSSGEDDMQPAILGNNLVSYLTAQNELNDRLLNVLQSMMEQITLIQGAFAFIDGGAMISSGAAKNIKNISNMTKKLINQLINDAEHLDVAFMPGSKSILSKKVYIT